MENPKRKPNENIQVFVRLRPANAREKAIRSMDMVDVPNNKEVVLRNNADTKLNKKFTFDRAFGPESKQNEVYAAVVAPMIEEVLSGYNCTVFAYGQTGTGKTHTMVGEEVPHLNNGWEDDNEVGMIPRAVNHLFDELRMMEMEFSMRVSYLELYNEELFDLLSPEETTKIRIFEDKKGGIIVHGLEEIPVHSKNDVYKLLAKGQEKRRTAPTLMNAQSSRSHTIFSIVVHMKDQKAEGEEMLKIGKLNLVDLAGSENISKAGNEKGVRARETVNINQSLLTLGRVMTALVEHQPHVPYRESKLTRLLQESLGGRTKTSIIATISPGHKDYEETANTLDYAHRAKNIQNRPEVNQRLTKKTVIKEFTEEIDRLKRDLMAARNKDGVFLTEDSYNDLLMGQESTTKELNEKVMQIRAIKEQLAEKEKLFTEVSLHLVEKTEELKTTQHNLVATGHELMHTQTKLHTTDEKYRQQRFLLKHHEHTERKLQNQAKDLLQVADTATADVSGLQEMVDRRRDVDAQNQAKVSQFPQRVESSFKGFSGTADQFRLEVCRETEMIKQQIDASLENAKKFSINLGDDLTGLYEMYESMKADNGRMLNELRKQSDAGVENILRAIEENFVQKEEKFAEEMKRRFEGIVENVNRQRENNDRIQGFATRLSEAVAAVLERGVRDIEAVSVEGRDKSKAIGEDIGRMEEMLRAMKEKWQEMDEIGERKEQKQMATFEAVTATIAESNKKVTAAHEAGDKLMADQLNELEVAGGAMKERASEMAQEVKTIENTVEAAKEDLQNAMEIYGQEQDEKLKSFDSKVTSVRKMIEGEVDGCSEESKKVSEKISSVNGKMEEFVNNFEDFASSCVQSVRSFCTNELETYRPTGETPAKKNFQYPKALSQTSPHGRILQRFRYDPNNSFNSSSDILPGLDDDEASPTEPNIEEGDEEEDEEDKFEEAEDQLEAAEKEELLNKRDSENAENENPNVQRKKRSTGSTAKVLNRPLLGVQQESVYVLSSDDD